jgi:hypothetical protein
MATDNVMSLGQRQPTRASCTPRYFVCLAQGALGVLLMVVGLGFGRTPPRIPSAIGANEGEERSLMLNGDTTILTRPRQAAGTY